MASPSLGMRKPMKTRLNNLHMASLWNWWAPKLWDTLFTEGVSPTREVSMAFY